MSDYFREQGEKGLALRILSNLAELKLEDAPLLRILGYRLRQLGLPELAVWTFEEVLRMREEEPQSWRDLALALTEAGQPQRALDLFWELVKTPWDGRFREVDLIALGELNALLATSKTKLMPPPWLPASWRSLPVDVRVVLNWTRTTATWTSTWWIRGGRSASTPTTGPPSAAASAPMSPTATGPRSSCSARPFPAPTP